jgi:hypothetical protein
MLFHQNFNSSSHMYRNISLHPLVTEVHRFVDSKRSASKCGKSINLHCQPDFAVRQAKFGTKSGRCVAVSECYSLSTDGGTMLKSVKAANHCLAKILNGRRHKNRHTIRGRGKGFSCGVNTSTPTAAATQPTLSPGVKRPCPEADHSSQSNACDKNAWGYTLTPQYVFKPSYLITHKVSFTTELSRNNPHTRALA